MRMFDLWPVFFCQEWSRNWPFVTGFAVTGYLIAKMTANFTEEDLRNFKFVQEHKRHCPPQGILRFTSRVWRSFG
ncbi:hypothetical protein C2845_PM03G35930 [Panicum miliaceum]|uniref:Uncharacterized protein n=1 Tax=Panicum miliaceum TaxID=4540 RepID=A0A3L6TBV1_PANMI|nr:hypothetical protein C2845_PM03G35930 [Panicum miliaceum]